MAPASHNRAWFHFVLVVLTRLWSRALALAATLPASVVHAANLTTNSHLWLRSFFAVYAEPMNMLLAAKVIGVIELQMNITWRTPAALL